MTWELRLGRYQDVMQDVTCDLLAVDAPYSERIHDGHFAGSVDADGQAKDWLTRHGYDDKRTLRRPLLYGAWSASDVRECVEFWLPRTRGWMVSITDHVLAPAWEQAMRDGDRYVFAPLPFLEVGKQPRLTGDGPASWTCWIVVSRPKSRAFASWGSLPGGYTTERKDQDRMPGGKPLWFMEALIRDYSRPGQVVADCCAGMGTTMIAALRQGRSAIGAECDPDTHAKATARLSRGFQPSLLVPQVRVAGVQDKLL